MAVSKSIIVIGVVAVLGAGGWYIWDNYGDKLLGKSLKVAQAPVAPKPAVKPSAPADSSKMSAATGGAAPVAGNDKLIDELLTLSGYKHMASALPEQIIAGAASARAGKSQAAVSDGEMEKMLKEAFTAKGFIDRGASEVKKNFDEKRVKAAIEMMSTPLSKRMTEMEKAQPSKADVEAFAAQPPTAQRMDLIRKLDKASKSTELMSQLSIAAARAAASSAAANDPKKLARIDAEIETARGQMMETLRNNVLGGMALIYRKSSDADLTEYVKLQESDNARWLNSILSSAILEETKAGASKVGEKIAAMKETKPTVSATKNTEPKTTEIAASKSAAQETKPMKTATASATRKGSRSGKDSRECLDLPTNVEIIKCAEQFR
jgi:hypothetical protein